MAKKRAAKQGGPKARLRLPDLELERALWDEGYDLVIGLDEAGVAAVAGPVVAGAVVLPRGFVPPEGLLVADCKLLTAREREEAFSALEGLVTFATAEAQVTGSPVAASVEAMRTALESLRLFMPPGMAAAVVDYHRLEVPWLGKVVSEPGADLRHWSVAAASIVAKVTRDRLMAELDRKHPGYGFGHNKGYLSDDHLDGLLLMGPSPVHRPWKVCQETARWLEETLLADQQYD